MRKPRDPQPSLFGEVSPITGEPCTHPPLCNCGHCQMPVLSFTIDNNSQIQEKQTCLEDR